MNEHFLKLTSTLFACQWTHLHNHWLTKGQSYYGDHLMFMRIYEGISEEIDGLVEKWVASGEVPDMSVIIGHARAMTKSLEGIPDFATRSLAAEKTLQKVLSEAFDHLESKGQLSLGMNDFLAALANAHETAIYLLQQRRKQAAKVKDLAQNKVTNIPDSSPFSQFFQNPAFAETRQFVQSGAVSNTLPGQGKVPPTVDDILLSEPGSETLSTLSRLKVNP